MWTLGIDVGKYNHCAHVLDAEGRDRLEGFGFANSAVGLARLEEALAGCGAVAGELRVGMEATGHYWLVLFEKLLEKGHEVVLINPLVTAARRNVSVRGQKTDPVDALRIAELLREERLPVSAVARAEVFKLRTLTRLRYDLAQQTIAEKLSLGALLDRAFPEHKHHFSDVVGKASCAVLMECPTAEHLKKIDVRKLTGLLEKASRGRMGREEAQALKTSAKHSFCVSAHAEVLALEIRFAVERINQVLSQIARLDEQLGAYFTEQQELLQSIPGIGPVWAPTILAEVLPIFDPEHPRGARKFVAMAGLDPKSHQSGQSQGKDKMSKRGSRYLRTAAIQAAEVAACRAKDPLFAGVYLTQRQRGKSHAVALSHVANKMLHVIFAVLRNKTEYEPKLQSIDN